MSANLTLLKEKFSAWFDRYFWLTLLLSLPALGPLTAPGYHWGAHDARSAVYFLFQFDKAISDGILYPRWAPDFAFGYGYPFFNIYGPLSSYVGQFFVWLGFGYTDAIKLVFGLSLIASGLTMYLFARDLLGRPAGFLAGLVYVYLPYHLFDIYVRAALAESVGLVFVPLVMWAYFRVMTRPSLGTVLWGAVAYACLMFTSNLLALLLTPILGLYVVVLLAVWGWQAVENKVGWRRVLTLKFWLTVIQRGLPAGAILGLGLALSAIFFLPAFFERNDVRLDQWIGGRYAFGDDFVEFFQLFSPRWGFGASIPGPDDAVGFQLGLAAIVLFVLSFFIVPRLQSLWLRVTLYFWQVMALLIAYLTLPVSAWVWTVLPLSSFAQFPWRMLAVLAPALALVAGAILTTAPLRQPVPIALKRSQFSALQMSLPLALLVLLSSFPYLQADMRDPKPTEGPVNLAGLFRFQQSADELTGSTRWVEEIPTWSPLADIVIEGGDITSRVVQTEVWADDGEPLLGVNAFQMDSVHEFVWFLAADDAQAVTFFIPYYPGWTATLYEDTAPENPELYPYGRIGQPIAELEIETTSPEGWMRVPVPEGTYFLELRFEDTPIRIAGTWLSLVTAILLAGAWIFRARLEPLLIKVGRGIFERGGRRE